MPLLVSSRILAVVVVVALIATSSRRSIHFACEAGIPSPALYYDQQLVDHLSTPPRVSDGANYHRAHDNDGNRILGSATLLSSNTTLQEPSLQQLPTYWTQRYYVWDEHFGGPGSPIFVILGGEGNIEPSTGILYPFISHHLAVSFNAYVLQPEHRFYGTSQPISTEYIYDQTQRLGLPDPRIQLLTYEQALLDAMRLMDVTRKQLGCSLDRFSSMYCPIITVGGSYPGFLSAMARIMYPHIVDMAYAASAPMLFYAQQIPQTAYYEHITKVADGAVPGCADAVAETMVHVWHDFRNGKLKPMDVGACPNTIPHYCANDMDVFLEELLMMVGYTFANANMAYYPPSSSTRLYQSCKTFLDTTISPIERLRRFLIMSLAAANDDDDDDDVVLDHHNNSGSTSSTTTSTTCFNMSAQLPTGPNATISGGDWSGIGTGSSGESWDFQTCTLCVEAIGFDNATSMFSISRPWTINWLNQHCANRFGVDVVPQPYTIKNQWHIDNPHYLVDQRNVSRILFTNGLQDGWSVSGYTQSISDDTIVVLNFPHGAHHSDLSGKGPTDDDTDDIKHGYNQIRTILSTWLQQLKVQQQQETAEAVER